MIERTRLATVTCGALLAQGVLQAAIRDDTLRQCCS